MKYHINNEGSAGPCRATAGKCPFGDASDHYDSPEQARAAFEASMADATFTSGMKVKEFRLMPHSKEYMPLTTAMAKRLAEGSSYTREIVSDYWDDGSYHTYLRAIADGRLAATFPANEAGFAQAVRSWFAAASKTTRPCHRKDGLRFSVGGDYYNQDDMPLSGVQDRGLLRRRLGATNQLRFTQCLAWELRPLHLRGNDEESRAYALNHIKNATDEELLSQTLAYWKEENIKQVSGRKPVEL